MDYEKKYKEALKRANEQLNGAKVFDYGNEQIAHNIRTTVYNIFPELKKSDDERIREEIEQFLKLHDVWNKEWFDWLGKQREPKDYNSIDPHFGKPINKVEPKFKVGDWVVTDLFNIVQIKAIDNDKYVLEDTMRFSISVDYADNCWHRWTIKDAKEGDVLHSPSHRLIWIYKDIGQYYACVNMNYTTENVNTNGLISIPNDVCPATKDEQTILFAKMKEAGYEWDADKKELINKLENRL